VGDDEATRRWVPSFMLLGERPWGASTTSGRDGVAVGGCTHVMWVGYIGFSLVSCQLTGNSHSLINENGLGLR
jgi:hypothetical protein